MAEDVVAQLDALGAERVHLVGHDWGAVIGFATAALAPERLHSLVTLAIPHPGRLADGIRKLPRQLLNSWYMAFFQLRGVADFALQARDWALLRKLWRDWSPGWSPEPSELDQVVRTLEQPGVKRAALAYYRAIPRRRSPAGRRTVELIAGKIAVPTLAFTGTRDGCMDTRMHDLTLREEDFPAGFELVRMGRVGHFLHQERPEQINRKLLDWLARATPSGRLRERPRRSRE